MALYPTLATLLTTSGLAVTALFYVYVAAPPPRTMPVNVCKFSSLPKFQQCHCLPGAWLLRTGFRPQDLRESPRLRSCLLLPPRRPGHCACAGRYEVTRSRQSRRLAEELGMGLAASLLLVRPRGAVWLGPLSFG